jgi:hypothetical protein
MRPGKLTFDETLVVHRVVQCWGFHLYQLIKPGWCSPLRTLSRSSLSLSLSLSRSLTLTLTLTLALALAPSLLLPPALHPSTLMCTLELCLSLWQAGLYGANGGPCTPCAAGNHKSWVGEGLCDKCPGGTFKAGTGAGACSACPPGKISLAGSSKCSVTSLSLSIYLLLALSFSLPPSLPPSLHPSFSLSWPAYNLNPTP